MIVGHQTQWQFLKKSAESKRISHAYLFWGQSRLGKNTLAKEFIKLLNCQAEQKIPCQNCWPCKAFGKEIHPDLIVIRPEGKEIKISQIRELQRFLSFRPHSANYKAVILKEGERMNQEAQSCLLKTLEEPTPTSLIIITSEHPAALFPTILSRVQKIKISPISKFEIENYLKNQKVPLPEIEKISSLSFGRPSLAIEFLNNPQKLDKEYQKIREISKVSQKNLAFRFQYVKELISQKENPKETLERWLRYFRDILRSKIGLPTSFKILPPSNLNFSTSQLKKIINSIEEINSLISSTNINLRLALETLMLKI